VWRTSEIRWFLPGILPPEILSWFSAGHVPDSEPVQIHEYLLFPDCESVGVKLREQRFEIKAKSGPSRPLHLALGITGRTDDWVKWSLSAEELQDFSRVLHRSGQWLKLRKERFLHRLSVEGDGLVEISGGDRNSPHGGCNIELTRLEVESGPRSWFSFGFEARGPSLNTAEILEQGAHRFFQGHGPAPGIRLNRENSLSYPAWLMKFLKE
jgi:hypothetical protein